MAPFLIDANSDFVLSCHFCHPQRMYRSLPFDIRILYFKSSTIERILITFILFVGKRNDNVTLICDASTDSMTVRMDVLNDDNSFNSETIVRLTATNIGKIQGDLRGSNDRWFSRGDCDATMFPPMHIDGGWGNDIIQGAFIKCIILGL